MQLKISVIDDKQNPISIKYLPNVFVGFDINNEIAEANKKYGANWTKIRVEIEKDK